ncbi:MAG: hypothetical protein NZ847_05580, partial [Acidobacteria bacterium]|nr:hypothetical protein [Acidobacteriota bacterium]
MYVADPDVPTHRITGPDPEVWSLMVERNGYRTQNTSDRVAEIHRHKPTHCQVCGVASDALAPCENGQCATYVCNSCPVDNPLEGDYKGKMCPECLKGFYTTGWHVVPPRSHAEMSSVTRLGGSVLDYTFDDRYKGVDNPETGRFGTIYMSILDVTNRCTSVLQARGLAAPRQYPNKIRDNATVSKAFSSIQATITQIIEDERKEDMRTIETEWQRAWEPAGAAQPIDEMPAPDTLVSANRQAMRELNNEERRRLAGHTARVPPPKSMELDKAPAPCTAPAAESAPHQPVAQHLAHVALNPLTNKPFTIRYYAILEKRRRLPGWDAIRDFLHLVKGHQTV